jgi:hypothetical protein
MSLQPEHSPSVRRVVLPSGKTIEIVYFGDPAAEPSRDGLAELHICGSCSSELVYPTAWEPADDGRWELTLRCPNCEWVGEGVFEHSAVEALDERLDEGTKALSRDLYRLAQANMEDEVERFVSALEADHVLPMDF